MSEHMSDARFGKVFAGTLAGMVALTIGLIILAHAVGGGAVDSDVKVKATDEVTLARTAPAGGMAVGEAAEQPAAAASAEALSGDQVYQTACAACHAAGIAGAPKLGDAAAWGPRIAQGNEVLYEHAINGFNAMPAKGGNVSLSDDAVRSAVDFMVGAESAGQETGTASQVTTTTADSASDAGDPAQPADTQTAAADHSAGQSVYNATCAVCHNAGVAEAPKPGDLTAWEKRLVQGPEVLYEHALKGFNAMPPKGGNIGLSDGDVKAAVDYMLSTVQ